MGLVVNGFYDFLGWVYFCFLYYGAISVWVYAATRSRKSPDIAYMSIPNNIESYRPPMQTSPIVEFDQEPSEDDDVLAVRAATTPSPMFSAAYYVGNELVDFLRNHRFSREFIQAVMNLGACTIGDLNLVVLDDDVKRELLQAVPDSSGEEVRRLTEMMRMIMTDEGGDDEDSDAAGPQGSRQLDANTTSPSPSSWTGDRDDNENDSGDDGAGDDDNDDGENSSVVSFQVLMMDDEPPLPSIHHYYDDYQHCDAREWLQCHGFSDALIQVLYHDLGAYIVEDLFMVFGEYEIFVHFRDNFKPCYVELRQLMTVLKCEFPHTFPPISFIDEQLVCYWEYVSLMQTPRSECS